MFRNHLSKPVMLIALIALVALAGVAPTAQGAPTLATLFSDDFNDGNASGWTQAAGTWSVVQDSGSYVYYMSAAGTEGRTMTGSQSWTDYSVEARVKVTNFGGSNRAFVAGRVLDFNNYYAASLYNASGGTQLEIRKKVSGSSSTLVSKAYTVATGTWYTVKLEMTGSTLKMYVNNVLELTATDTSRTSGAIGLIPYKAAAMYDDVIVSTGGTSPTATPTRTNTPGGATATPTRTNTPGGATATPTRTNTPGGPTATPTRTPTRTNTPVGPTATPTSGGGGGTGQVGYSTQNGGTTGGAGGTTVTASTGTQIHQALCGRASNTTPIIIRVSGTINHGNTTQVSGSCSTAADKIEIKDVSNISIIGVGTTAIFDQIGIHIRNSHNIIIQNVHVRNVKKSGSPISNGGDAIGMETDVTNVWVDHSTLEASGGEAEGYDGLFDLKDNTRYVTLSWSILKNSERGGLVGSGDSDSANNFITYHHNHYQNLNSRVPLLRFATAHAFNNYYNGIVETGMNPRIGGKIKAENNYFTNAKDPLGTFYTDDMGFWQVSGNIFGAGVTWSPDGPDMHPAGPNVVSTTSISIPYSYSLDAAANVPSIVLNGAGVGKIGN